MIVQYAQEGASARIASFEYYKDVLLQTGNLISERLQQGRRLLLCGNGGSASEAQHIAAEYVGRFSKRMRLALPAIALSSDTAILTAVGNDYGFENIFSRQVEAYGQEGDILIASSTSGNSRNCIVAVEQARELGLYTIAFTGKNGGAIASLVDVVFAVESNDTPIIQEIHLAMQHILCKIVEDSLPTQYDSQ